MKVHVDWQLLEEAKQVFGVDTDTDTDTIEAALCETVLRRRQLDAIDAIAALPLDVDPQPITYDRA